MQNIGNLHEDNSFFQMFQTVKTIFYSILVIIAILCIEALSLTLLPAISPLILYMTSTTIVLFAFYGTPWLVFKSVDAEQHYLKSMKESFYMTRLSMLQIMNVIILPIIFNIVFCKLVPDGYRGKPTDLEQSEQIALPTPKFDQDNLGGPVEPSTIYRVMMNI
jgi:hypothetical protein